MSRAAFATTSSTSARGKSNRPSGLNCPPTEVTASMQLGMASDSPTRSSTSRAAAWIRCTPFSSRGRYRPPSIPGRTAFSSSRSGAALSLCRAALPPMRRLLTAASLMMPPAVTRHGNVRVAGHVGYCDWTAGSLSIFRHNFLANVAPPICSCGWVLSSRWALPLSPSAPEGRRCTGEPARRGQRSPPVRYPR